MAKAEVTVAVVYKRADEVKAEALREAADAWVSEVKPSDVWTPTWLRERADALWPVGETPPDEENKR